LAGADEDRCSKPKRKFKPTRSPPLPRGRLKETRQIHRAARVAIGFIGII
jgi:hypothetical protein